jgi:PKD repeat protein
MLTRPVTSAVTRALTQETTAAPNKVAPPVPAIPVANFSGAPTSGTAPLQVQFTDLTTGIPTSWAWTFGDGGTSTQQNPLYTYAASGTYNVTLTATNGLGSNGVTKNSYIVAALGPPVNTVAPVVTGTPASGNTLSCSTGTWTNAGPFTYQWLDNGSPIVGATNNTFALTDAQKGFIMSCRVTSTGNGSASADSNSLAVSLLPFSGSWIYTTPVTGAAPAANTIVHANNTVNKLLVSDVNSSGSFIDFSQIQAGNVITINSQAYVVQAAPQIFPGYASITIDPTTQQPPGTYTVTITSGVVVFTPADLFLLGENGVWYDPSDLSSMFQTINGDPPVTAVEQPVGLLLDKRKGLAATLAPFVNGTLDTSTWTKGVGWSTTATTAASDGTQAGSSNLLINAAATNYPLANGFIYRWTVIVTARSAGGSITVSAQSGAGSAININSPGTYIVYGVGGSGVITAPVGVSCSISSITIEQVAGNHALQATAASRPVLSARVNLLTFSEQFDNAAWTKANATITPNATMAPDGTITADLVTASASSYAYARATGFSAGFTTASAYFKAGNGGVVTIDTGGINANDVATFNVSTGVVVSNGINNSSAAIEAVANGFYRCSVTRASAITALYFGKSGATINDTFYMWGAQLEGPALSTYQWITTATNYNSVGFPYYLRFDGVDDGLATASASFAAADKAGVWAGIYAAQPGTNMLVELSTNAPANNGAFYISAFESTTVFGFRTSNGSINRGYNSAAKLVATAYTLSAMLDGAAASVATSVIPRINGTIDQTTLVGAVAAGNFGNYPLYIGRRAGTALPFNGQLYSLIIRGVQSSAQAISDTETWVAGKTGVTL